MGQRELFKSLGFVNFVEKCCLNVPQMVVAREVGRANRANYEENVEIFDCWRGGECGNVVRWLG